MDVDITFRVHARSQYRKVRGRASYAFALDGVAHKPCRATTAEDALLGAPATVATFRAATDAELAAAGPLSDDAFKVPLAGNVIVGTLSDLTEEQK